MDPEMCARWRIRFICSSQKLHVSHNCNRGRECARAYIQAWSLKGWVYEHSEAVYTTANDCVQPTFLVWGIMCVCFYEVLSIGTHRTHQSHWRCYQLHE